MLRKNHKLLIFGGAGSLGHELVSFYKDISGQIVVVSRDEAKHWELRNKFKNDQLKTVICDVRDSRRVSQIIREENPDYIIIAQALKQVDTCENQPSEAIDTNIIGVRNILDAIEENLYRSNNNIMKVCFVSTDKACNPINVYGMCKSISEKMVLAVGKKYTSTIFVVTRYGNVLSSKGSIIPLFLKQAKEASHFTVTDRRMTRFIMLLEESVALIHEALLFGNSGDIWIPALDSFAINDLANYFSLKFDKPVTYTGIRPGEKIHEVLMSDVERMQSKIVGESFVINSSNFTDNILNVDYSSKDHLVSFKELTRRLDQFLVTQTYDRNSR